VAPFVRGNAALAVDQAEFSVGGVDVPGPGLGHEAAMEARLASGADGAAVGALEQARVDRAVVALLVRPIAGCPAVGVQGPIDVVLGKAMAKYTPRMVDDGRVLSTDFVFDKIRRSERRQSGARRITGVEALRSRTTRRSMGSIEYGGATP
jgi:hypothetical protein